ncbi:MAG: sigma-70 family RNA polymerase sigma factor [Dehalobacter sp.]|nr:sigma-70 family RNA polymerase sigma factor [Dehalobacter sp.]
MNQDQEHFLSQLFDQHFIDLYRYLYHRTRDKELAYDLAQEAFAILCSKIDEVYGHDKPTGWLYVTANNLVNNHRKRKDNRTEYLASYLDIPSLPQGSGLWELLPLHLSEEEYQLLVWRFQEDLSYETISSRLNISAAACRNRVYRALNKCRDFLRKDDLF